VKRIITTILILILIIPLLVFSDPNIGTQNNLEKYGLFSFLAIVGTYLIIEFNRFIFDKNENKIDIIFFTTLSSLALFLILIFEPVYISEISTKIQESNEIFWFLTVTVVITIIFSLIFLVYATFNGIEFKNTGYLICIFMIIILSTMFIGLLSTSQNFGGWQFILFPLMIAIIVDSIGYFVGIKFGKNSKKISPKISPNKTAIGTYSGLIVGVVVGTLWYLLLVIPGEYIGSYVMTMDVIWGILISLALSLLALFGDLFFSSIKRSYDKKDFSTILPGHGGVLDRFDSHSMVLIGYGILWLLQYIV